MLGQAALAMWWDMAPGLRGQFEHWHSHEHFPERLALPGFLRASRWAHAGGGEGFFVLYELADHAALASPAYLARLNAPTEESRRMMPHHRSMVRSPCRVLASEGAALAAHVLTIRLAPVAGREDGLRSGLDATVRRLAGVRGLAGCHLLQTDTPDIPATTEQAIRGFADRAADWIVLVTGYEADALRSVEQGELSPPRLQQIGAAAGALADTYSLRHAASPREARVGAAPFAAAA